MHSVNQHPCEVRDYNYPNFIDKEIEAQRRQMICPRLHDPGREAQLKSLACYHLLNFPANERITGETLVILKSDHQTIFPDYSFFLTVRGMGQSQL